jgi:hypothetical protein
MKIANFTDRSIAQVFTSSFISGNRLHDETRRQDIW